MAFLDDPRVVTALRANRDAYNSSFEAARRLHPSLVGDEAALAFGELVQAALPCLEHSGFAHDALFAIFQAAIKSVKSGKGPGIQLLAITAANSAKTAFASSPDRFLSECSRAVAAVASSSRESIASWLDIIARSGNRLGSMREFEIAGLAAAWLSGLVRYRDEALRLLAELPPDSVSAILGIEPLKDSVSIVEKLAGNAWLSPPEAAGRATPPACAAFLSGGHKALGGPFFAFPVVGKDRGGNPGIIAGTDTFRIHAARQGVWFEPEEPGEITSYGTEGSCFNRERFLRVAGEGTSSAALLSSGVSSSCLAGNVLVFASPGSFMVCVAGFPGGPSGVQ